MPPQEIRKFALDEPFIPFRLYVTDGSSYEIRHPIEIQVFPMQVSIAINPDDAGLYQSSVRVAPNHVTRIEFLPNVPKLQV